ncbi:MAG: hypothetical protein H6766_03445 [Candidatus Peribacteria bacterium]|nr:MAG: hypothetical protein H6766_03445 [Candidatus Peribacteria bacterium]
MYQTIIDRHYLLIKYFATNTFDAQSTSTQTVQHYAHDIFDQLARRRVTVESYLGNGILIMEQISKTIDTSTLRDLPAGQASVNIFVVGTVIYLIIFKDTPVGIQIDSEDLANTMHFILEKLQTD